jgi:hypothetical protein
LLHEQFAIRSKKQNMHTPVPESALVDNGPHRLTDHMIMLVYNVEQLVWHIERFPFNEYRCIIPKDAKVPTSASSKKRSQKVL